MDYGKVGRASACLGILGCVALFTGHFGVGFLLCIIGIILAAKILKNEQVGHGSAKVGMFFSVGGLLIIVLAAIYAGNNDLRKDVGESINISTADSEVEESEYETSIENREIFNKHGISIKVTGIEKSSSETEVNFVIISESEKDYSIAAHTYAVNGLMAGSNLYGIGTVNVPAGKKAKISISVKNSWLEDNGILKISDFDVIFWAYYDNFKEWNTGKIKIKTNIYSKDEKYSPDGDKIYSDDNIAVWYLGNDKNKYYFSVKNKSDYNASYTVENCSINGWSYQLTNYTYDLNSVPLNSNSYDLFTLEIDNDFMEDSDISVIENIEFDVLLENEYSNSGDWWEHKTDKITIEN